MEFILNYVNTIVADGLEGGELILLFFVIFLVYQNYSSKKKLKNIDTAVNNSSEDENPQNRGIPLREIVNRIADRAEEVVHRLDRLDKKIDTVEQKVDQHITSHAERRL